MKKRSAILLTIILLISDYANAQESTKDTSFFYRITNARWMPDGSALLIALVKVDKSDKIPPERKTYLYNLENKTAQPFNLAGGSFAVSPDQKKVVFLRKEGNMNKMLIYDFATKSETVAVADSLGKYSPSWSADNKMIAYNCKVNSNARDAAIEIFVYDLTTGKVKQITHTNGMKSWEPAFAPTGNKICYYLEKDDRHDQIWLTDSEGSFFTNLTKDTTTHNYYPLWIDSNTITYTQSPDMTMTIQTDGKNRKKVPGLNGDQIRYNYKTGKAVYVREEPVNRVFLYNWKENSTIVLLELDQFLKTIRQYIN